MNVQEMVGAYIQLRDRKEELDAAHAKRVASLKTLMAELERHLQAALVEANAESIRTDTGTVFTAMQTSVRTADAGVFRRFVLDSGAWDLIETRPSKPAVEAWLAEQGELPPGVEISRTSVVRVNRPR